MRKEELLLKKSEAVKDIQWYVKNVLTPSRFLKVITCFQSLK